jgi:hypothetical protein
MECNTGGGGLKYPMMLSDSVTTKYTTPKTKNLDENKSYSEQILPARDVVSSGGVGSCVKILHWRTQVTVYGGKPHAD